MQRKSCMSYIDLIKELVFRVLAFGEVLQILKDRRIDLNRIVVPHRILPQEVQGDEPRLVLREGDVPDLKRAAPEGLRLALGLLVADSEGELVDDVDGRSKLSLNELYIT